VHCIRRELGGDNGEFFDGLTRSVAIAACERNEKYRAQSINPKPFDRYLLGRPADPNVFRSEARRFHREDGLRMLASVERKRMRCDFEIADSEGIRFGGKAAEMTRPRDQLAQVLLASPGCQVVLKFLLGPSQLSELAYCFAMVKFRIQVRMIFPKKRPIGGSDELAISFRRNAEYLEGRLIRSGRVGTD
jgi:hypothetical protein